MATLDSIIRLRRGLDSERSTITLDSGEIAFSTDIKRVFIGDGSTLGGYVVGNINTNGFTPSPSAYYGDVFYDRNTTITYLLTTTASPHLLQSYARITPITDNLSLTSINGVFGINFNYFNNSNTGFVRLSGGSMSGYLNLYDDPIYPYHASTKRYTDAAILNAIANASGDTKFVHLTGDIINGSVNILSTLEVSDNVLLYKTLQVSNSATFGGNIDLKDNTIIRASKVVKNIYLDVSPNNTYLLSQNDNGCVLSVSGAGLSSVVYCPDDLNVGFNVTIMQNSTSKVSISAQYNSDSVINQIDGYSKIRKIYGVANLISVDSGIYLLTGDLSA